MKASHITTFKFNDGEFFAAYTDSGAIRVGMNGLCAIEFPEGHAQRAEAEALTLDNVDAFIVGQVEKGNISF